MSESRSQVIWRHVRAYIHETATSWPTYAAEVRARYEATVPEEARTIEFSNHRDPYQRMRLDAQRVRRFEDEVHWGLPADLEEAMVLALAEPWRGKCLEALAARYGLLAAPIPDPRERQAPAFSIARLSREFGELVEAMAPALADGKLDQRDIEHARVALAELAGLEAQCAALRSVLETIAAQKKPAIARVHAPGRA